MIQPMRHVYTKDGFWVGGFIDAEAAQAWIDSRVDPSYFELGNLFRPEAQKSAGVYLEAGDKRTKSKRLQDHGFLPDKPMKVERRTKDQRAVDDAMADAS
jgi:hypothetical protein